MGLSIYPFKSWKDLKGCRQVVEAIERVHSDEGSSSGRKESTEREEIEFEGMLS